MRVTPARSERTLFRRVEGTVGAGVLVLLMSASAVAAEERRQGVPGDREERRQGVPGDREERRQDVPADQQWTEFVSRDDRFTANFPGAPQVTATTYKSQFGADLPARVYSAAQGPSRYSLTVVDYGPVEKLLTEKSKSCPPGAETCRGNASPTSSTGAGYWKVDVAGAVIYATWQFMQRDAKVTELVWNNIDLVEGHLLHLTNADKSRTYAGIFMHEGKLYISEATVPAGYPEPGLFQQSLGWIDENGRGIRYQTLYHHGLPTPPRAR